MQDTVRRLVFVHLIVLGVSVVVVGLVMGWPSALSSGVGTIAFSLPVIGFGVLVVRASKKEPARFVGRFMLAEVLKWASSGALLYVAFASKAFQPLALLVGFILSVLVQLFIPILVKKGSES